MKIKTTYFIISIAIIAIIIIYFSFFWPPVSEHELAGAIGKVDKYQNEQMKENDIKLRSDFVKDTAILRKSINDLVNFAFFTHQTVTNIETWWLPQLEKYYSSTISHKNLLYLRDYVELLKNSGSNIQSIVEMLVDFYYKRSTDKSIDVESKLVSFANFVNQMVERDSIFETIIADIDKSVKNSIEAKGRAEQINKLKEIRDKMLYTSLIYAVNMRDEKMIIRCAGLEVYKIDNIEYSGDIVHSVSNKMAECNKEIIVGYSPIKGLDDLLPPGQNANFYEGIVYSAPIKHIYDKEPIGCCTQFGRDLGIIKVGNNISLSKDIFSSYEQCHPLGLPEATSNVAFLQFVYIQYEQ